LRTLVLESKEQIGRPIQCGEAISDRTLKYSNIADGEWLIHPITRYRIFSPSGDFIGSRTKGYSIRRDLFDSELANVAKGNGAEILLSTNVISASKSVDLWSVETNRGRFQGRGVVLAAGPTSHLNSEFGLSKNIDPMRGLGAKIQRKDSSNMMDFYVKAELMGGYAWYFPRGDEVNIGIAGRSDLNTWFRWFLNRLQIKEEEIVSWHGGVVPDSGPIEKFIGGSVIAVGDCGGFSHPVSKGGIYCAMFTGREGAQALTDHLSGDQKALSRLDSSLRSHSGFSQMNIKRRDFLAQMDDETLDGITSIIKGRDIQAIDRKKIAIEAMKHPHLYPLIKKGLSFVRSKNDWLDYTF
jgi:flavin-dependent dehydrogenase